MRIPVSAQHLDGLLNFVIELLNVWHGAKERNVQSSASFHSLMVKSYSARANPNPRDG